MKKAWEKITRFFEEQICNLPSLHLLLWLAFFDKNDFMHQYRFRQQLNTFKERQKKLLC